MILSKMVPSINTFGAIYLKGRMHQCHKHCIARECNRCIKATLMNTKYKVMQVFIHADK